MERSEVLFVVGIVSAALACAGGGAGKGDRTGQEVNRSIEEVQETHSAEWMKIPGVVGTGIGLCDDEPCIKVFVVRRTEEIDEKIPDLVEGYAVRIEVTGEFQPQDARG